MYSFKSVGMGIHVYIQFIYRQVPGYIYSFISVCTGETCTVLYIGRYGDTCKNTVYILVVTEINVQFYIGRDTGACTVLYIGRYGGTFSVLYRQVQGNMCNFIYRKVQGYMYTVQFYMLVVRGIHVKFYVRLFYEANFSVLSKLVK